MDQETDGHVRMTDHTNLYNKALTMIKRKGFELFLRPDETDEESFTRFGVFFAKKGNRNFNADDPLRLLGMISIWEEHGDDWNRNPKYKSERIRAELMDEAYPDSPQDYENWGEKRFRLFVKKCQSFFALGMFPDVEIADDIAAQDLFAIIFSLGQQ